MCRHRLLFYVVEHGSVQRITRYMPQRLTRYMSQRLTRYMHQRFTRYMPQRLIRFNFSAHEAFHTLPC